MKKPDRFLLATNPRNEKSGEYIIHTVAPQFIAEVSIITNAVAQETRQLWSNDYGRIALFKKLNEENFILIEVQEYTPAVNENINKALDRAAHWYHGIAHDKLKTE